MPSPNAAWISGGLTTSGSSYWKREVWFVGQWFLGIVFTTPICTTCRPISKTHRFYSMDTLKKAGIQTVFHYFPWTRRPWASAVGRVCDSPRNTYDLSDCLVRLPLWVGLEANHVHVIQEVIAAAEKMNPIARGRRLGTCAYRIYLVRLPTEFLLRTSPPQYRVFCDADTTEPPILRVTNADVN